MKTVIKKIPNKKTFFIKFSLIFTFFLSLLSFSLYNMVKIQDNKKTNKKYEINFQSFNNSSIYTDDNYLITFFNLRYDLYLDNRYIDNSKLNIFLNIIENVLKKNIDKKKIISLSKIKKRFLVLQELTLKEMNLIRAEIKTLKELGFLQYFTSNNGKRYLYSPEFLKSKNDNRHYCTDAHIFQPWLGIFRNNKGEFGFEKYLKTSSETSIKSFETTRTGYKLYKVNDLHKHKLEDVKLSVNYNLQKDVHNIINEEQKRLQANNILVSVVKVDDGKITSLNQLKNFDPNNIKASDSKNMLDYYTNFLYEPGSVIKPITLLAAMDNKIVTDLEEKIKLEKYGLKIGKKRITDSHYYPELSIKDIIVHSSNIGTGRIALRMENNEFYDNLRKIGFFNEFNLETVQSKQFYFPDRLKYALNKNKMIQRVTTSFGYGFMSTPYLVQRMYNVIGNDGKYVDFSILNNSEFKQEEIYDKNLINNYIKPVLQDAVENGTGKATIIPGVRIMGKTGTAHISENGKYVRKYNSSFIGLVEDDFGNKYNILVLVEKPIYKYHYASQSAVPIFKKVVHALFLNNLIKINLL